MIENEELKYCVLGLTGMPGSGKGEICVIARELGIPVRSLGDVVRSHFNNICPDRNPMETGVFADEERNTHGKDVWARRLVDEVDELIRNGNGMVIIDGVRSGNEVDVFKEKWGDHLKVLCVHSSPATRYERLGSRGRNDDPDGIDDFKRRELRELGWGLGGVIGSADIILNNEGTMEELYLDARRLLEELME